MTPRLALFLVLGIDAAVLLFEASSLSLTYHGAKLLFGEQDSVMTAIIRSSLHLFGDNDIALRLPMIVMNLLSAFLLFVIAAPYARNERERVWLVLIFLLLPGILSSSLLVDSAALVTLGLFAFVYVRQRYGHWADMLLPLFVWMDSSFMILFLGLFVFAAKQRNYRFAVLYAILFFVSIWHFGFNTGGLPENQFLDTMGLFAAVFSPIVFIYLVYVLYRRLITRKTDLLWSLAVTALLISMILSFRQRIEIEKFAPYLMLALPLGMQTFYHSYRVRLRPFRKRYRILFILAMAILVLNAVAVFFNKAAYLVVDRPEHYFAYRAHVAKELAAKLKQKGITCIDAVSQPQMQLRLRFYGVGTCSEFQLRKAKDRNNGDVTIRYYNVPVVSYNVSKIPIQ